MSEEQLNKLKNEVKAFFEQDFSGHDYWHTIRVFNNAVYICRNEDANMLLIQLGSLLHDVDDYKLVGQQDEKFKNAKRMMRDINIDNEIVDMVCHIISQVSFKGADTVTPDTIEGKIVQDADRLDAIGAIGIARTFAYGGSHSVPIHDPEIKPKKNMSAEEYYASKHTTINHFYEKLLLLKGMMNTDTAKKIAEKRQIFMEGFLDEFYSEWEMDENIKGHNNL